MCSRCSEQLSLPSPECHITMSGYGFSSQHDFFMGPAQKDPSAPGGIHDSSHHASGCRHSPSAVRSVVRLLTGTIVPYRWVGLPMTNPCLTGARKKCQAHLFPGASTSCHHFLNTDKSGTLDWSPSLFPIRLFPQVRTALGDCCFSTIKWGIFMPWAWVLYGQVSTVMNMYHRTLVYDDPAHKQPAYCLVFKVIGV